MTDKDLARTVTVYSFALADAPEIASFTYFVAACASATLLKQIRVDNEVFVFVAADIIEEPS